MTRVEGLAPGTMVFLRVQAVDIAGNSSSFPSRPLRVRCLRQRVRLRRLAGAASKRLDPRGLGGGGRLESPGVPDGPEPSQRVSLRELGDAKDAALDSPAIDIPEGAFLTFFHTFELEEGFDGARIEASVDGSTFTDLGSMILEGGYNGSIDGVAAWTGGTLGSMKAVRVSLDGLAGPGKKIRFRILCDDSVGARDGSSTTSRSAFLVPGTAESRFTRGIAAPTTSSTSPMPCSS